MQGEGAAWNERFAGRDYLFGVEPNVFVAEACRDLPPGRALDLGCGEGRNAVWLAGRGHSVVGVDISAQGLAKAARLADAAGVEVEWVEADLRRWEPEPGAFDLVVLSYLQVPDDVRPAVHTKAKTALADGGRIVLVAHHRDNLSEGVGGPPTAEVLFTEDELRSDFEDLRIERCERVLRPVETETGVRSAVDVICIATT